MSYRMRAGFTLIELLVVIAIIAILAAILFPVFAQAREKARQAQCLSNTKQIATSLLMYAQDYDEVLPGYRFNCANCNPYAADARVGTSAKAAIFLNQVLNPYTKNDGIWRCPSNPRGWVNVDANNGTPSSAAFKSYGGQNSYAASNYLFSSNRGFPMASVSAPADTVSLIDAMYYNALPGGRSGLPCPLAGDPAGTAFVTGSWYPKYGKNLGNSYVGFGDAPEPPDAEAVRLGKARHQGTLNIVWLDGHAKAMPYERIVQDQGLTTGGTTGLWDPYKAGCR